MNDAFRDHLRTQLRQLEAEGLTKRERVITNLKRVSKPGLRVYKRSGQIPRVLGGLGIAIVSTSRGLMTDVQARKEHVGGEVLCQVW